MSKLFVSLLLALPAWAGEYAVLANGFRIHAERHETAGSSVRLYNKGGVTEVPATSIAWFEAEEVVAPPITPPVTPPKVDAPLPVRDTRTLVRDAAIRSGLPPTLVESVARVESALRPEAVSPTGALGVMQLMPATARKFDADPHDTAQNIDAGARLLRELLIKYGGDVVKALSAYNAGEGAVDRYRGMPPYPETQDYVDKVIRTYVSSGAK